MIPSAFECFNTFGIGHILYVFDNRQRREQAKIRCLAILYHSFKWILCEYLREGLRQLKFYGTELELLQS
jgi:hypothetical protein